jgi:hypothetical protein
MSVSKSPVALSEAGLREVVTSIYRTAKYESGSGGSSVPWAGNLLGPALYRARTAEMVLAEITMMAGKALPAEQLIPALAMLGNMLASDSSFQRRT